ncbi:MAG: hypothetical protein AABW73_05195 [Nanoarchaeota archaeon]
MTQNETLERRIIELIATDRIEMPISSLSGKLKRNKPKIAAGVDLKEYEDNFTGERVYARIECEDKEKARSMKEAVAEFSQEFPKYGAIIQGKIAEKRAKKETHLYFGMQEGRRLTSQDYMGVMTGMGISEARSEGLYLELMEVSRNLSKQRGGEERRIMIGKSESEED